MALAAVAVPGCAPRRLEDPIGVMADRSAGYSQRRAAAAEARRRTPADPRRIQALETILWQPGYPAWQRCDAVDQLVEHDEAAFRASLPRRFKLLDDWDTINHIFGLAVSRRWDDFTPVAVRNYARLAHGVADADRPERRVLEQLNPGQTVDQVVFTVFANATDAVSYAEQVAAWELLARLSDGPTLMQRLAMAPNTTPLVVDLKAAAAELGTVPANREGVLWLQHLRDPARRAFWTAAAAATSRLGAEQRRGLDLRHLGMLCHLADTEIARSTAELAGRVDVATRGADRHMTGPTYDGPMRDWPQTFSHWRDQLGWGDLAAIDLILRALRDPTLAASLFEQAERDRADTSTEYGGVLDADGDRFVAIGFEPMYRRHDLKFVPSQQMVERLYTAIAHYHFHAQRYRNSSYAGPGEGDLKTADRLNATSIVFTFIDRDRLNVDYYQPGRIVVDLGTLGRPATADRRGGSERGAGPPAP